jgi:hypothetical protein
MALMLVTYHVLWLPLAYMVVNLFNVLAMR